MTITELMAQAKEIYERPRTPRLCVETGISDIECNSIERLLIAHDYIGPIPDFGMFPNLKELHISRNISFYEFEQLNLSSIEHLYIKFEKKEPIIKINLPKLKKLEIYIANNDDDQLSLFENFNAVIDIRGCSALEELHLHHCTSYEIKTDTLPELKKLICCDYKNYNFDILRYTPNLVHLIANDCRLNNINFLDLVPNLVHLDLTFNELKDANKVFELTKLSSLHIYRNPLENIEKFKSLPFKTFITDKDHDFLMFVDSIERCANRAYSLLKSARKPDPKRKPFLQHLYDRQTDEQVFVRNFVSIIKQNIEYHTSTDKNWQKNILLTSEELTEFVLQEYPFIAEFFETRPEES